ncbi:MAG: DUF411 domain-containing protein [Longimicrobiales bacterium]
MLVPLVVNFNQWLLMLDRRRFVLTALAGGASLVSARFLTAMQSPANKLVIYKSPTCGCCQKWVDHVKASGFVTEVHDVEDINAIKTKHGIPTELQSCHTTLADRYVVEGHVPADVIQKLLKEKPAVVGIAAPGMPAGSPGMEVGTRKDAYDIVAFQKNGKTSVFARR